MSVHTLLGLCGLTFLLGIAGVVNWSYAILPDAIKSRLQTGTSELYISKY